MLTSEKPKQESAEEVISDSNDGDSETVEIIQMHEKVERPEMLLGSTYKVKTPQYEHALYNTTLRLLAFGR